MNNNVFKLSSVFRDWFYSNEQLWNKPDILKLWYERNSEITEEKDNKWKPTPNNYWLKRKYE